MIYASSATAHDFEIYAPNATFEDPLMCAHGVKQIKSAFYSLSKVFGESKIVEYGIEETIAGPGRGEHYKLMGKDVDVVALIKLRVEEGQVVRHEDCLSTDLERKTLRWDKKPLRNRETVKLPLLGRLAEIARRGSMLATHALMRAERRRRHYKSTTATPPRKPFSPVMSPDLGRRSFAPQEETTTACRKEETRKAWRRASSSL
ncbi:hypothetical protein ACLOJK_005995 [Asimina triloba]